MAASLRACMNALGNQEFGLRFAWYYRRIPLSIKMQFCQIPFLKVQEILTETQLVHPYIGISLYHHPFAKPLVKAAFGTFVSGCSHELFEYDRRAQPPSSQPSEPQPLNLSELSVRLNRPRNQPKTALTHSPTP